MRLICPRTTPRVLGGNNLIYDQIYQENISDLWRRSRTQTHKISKYQQNQKRQKTLFYGKTIKKHFV